jgi:hypothetical protein
VVTAMTFHAWRVRLGFAHAEQIDLGSVAVRMGLSGSFLDTCKHISENNLDRKGGSHG